MGSICDVRGIILAAGKSERMGSPKCLLPIGDKTFLEHVYLQAQAGGLTDVRIVLGHDAGRILDRYPQLPSQVIVNVEFEKGQLSSLLRGLSALENSPVDAIMVLLVDHPFVTGEVIRKLVQRFCEDSPPIVIPTCRGRRGHPVIFSRVLFPELKSAQLSEGAASVVRKHAHEIVQLDVGDEGVLIDIDTPEAYREYMLKRAPNATDGVTHG